MDQLPEFALPVRTLLDEDAPVAAYLDEDAPNADADTIARFSDARISVASADVIDSADSEAAADASYAVTRSGVVEAVREVLPTQVRAAEVAADEPAATRDGAGAAVPSLVVSPLALSAQGYPVPTETEVAALFDRWNAALQTGDPKEVVALYTKDATLLPTMSPKFCPDPDGKLEYFTHFLAKKPWGTVTERRIYRGHGIAVDTGHYTFHLGLTGEDVHARYTFTYVWDGAHWLISSHHSSAAPALAA